MKRGCGSATVISPPIDEEEIFQVAAALPAAQRAAYLGAACDGYSAVRASVEELLAAHDDAAFMERRADPTVSPEMEPSFRA